MVISPEILHPIGSAAARSPSGSSMAKKKSIVLVHSNFSSESLPQAGNARFNCCPRNKGTMGLRAMPKLDYGEFENMPYALRRKLFSSYERLQLALRSAQQQVAISASVPRPLIHHARNMSTTGVLFSKTRPSHDSFLTQSSRTRLRKSQPSGETFPLSHADAKWFLELPETIKRKHFTREERILLAAQCQDIIMDATDERLFRMGQQANRSNDTIDTESTITPRTSVEGCDDWRSSFRWLDENDDLDLRLNLDEYHQSILEKVPPSTSHSHRRRTFSLSARLPKTVTQPTITAKTRARRSASQSVTSTGRPSLSASPIEPNAAYYQDPEARLKLRVYLASAQKFDEAIEFGFPSVCNTLDGQNSRFRAAQQNSVNRQTFRADKSSFLLDDGDKDISRDLSESNHFAPPPTLHRKPVRANTSPYLVCTPGNREMTLRMTLTRPDLRADEKLLHGWQHENSLAFESDAPMGKEDLATPSLETLWSRDSGTGLVKKIWRRVKRR